MDDGKKIEVALKQYATADRYDIRKPPNDLRTYLGMTVKSNSVKLLFVSDPQTEMNHGAFSINAGYLMDGNVAGLAHLTEHALFQGTEKFPKPVEIREVVGKSGFAGADTKEERTRFRFAIEDESKTADIVARMADMLNKPLYKDIETEVDHICQVEYKHHDTSVESQLKQLQQNQSTSNHPYAGFNCGSIETWAKAKTTGKIDPKTACQQLFDQHYGSNLLSIVIITKWSMVRTVEELLPIISTKIPNRPCKQPIWQHPYDQTSIGYLIKMVPGQNIADAVLLHFPTPDFIRDFPNDSVADLVAYAIEREGPGTLADELRSKGLATSIAAYYRTIARHFGFMTVQFNVVASTFERIPELLKLFFIYVRRALIDQCRTAYPEFKQWKELCFVQRLNIPTTKCDKVTEYLVETMDIYGIADVLHGPEAVGDFSDGNVTKVIGHLTTNNFNMYEISRGFAKDADYQTEQYLKTKYKREKIGDPILLSANEDDASITFTAPPPLVDIIPKEFGLRPSVTPAVQKPLEPEIFDKNVKIWTVVDQRDTKSVMKVRFVNEYFVDAPSIAIWTRIFVQMLRVNSAHILQLAKKCGQIITIEWKNDGILLTIDGFADGQKRILDEFIGVLRSIKPSEFTDTGFEHIREQVDEDLKDENESSYPLDDVLNTFGILLNSQTIEISKTERDASFDKSDKDNVTNKDGINGLFEKSLTNYAIEIFNYGNVAVGDNAALYNIVKAKFDGEPLELSGVEMIETCRGKPIVLKHGKSYVYERTKKERSTMYRTGIYLQAPSNDIHSSACVRLVAKYMNEKIEILKRACPSWKVANVDQFLAQGTCGIALVLVSPSMPEFMETKIEQFIQQVHKDLSTEGDFDGLKQRTRAAAVDTRSTRASTLFREIVDGSGVFNRTDGEDTEIREMTREALHQFLQEMIAVQTRRQLKVTIVPITVVPFHNEYRQSKNCMAAINNLQQLLPNMPPPINIADVVVFKQEHCSV